MLLTECLAYEEHSVDIIRVSTTQVKIELYFFKQWREEIHDHGINWNELDIFQELLVSSHPL